MPLLNPYQTVVDPALPFYKIVRVLSMTIKSKILEIGRPEMVNITITLGSGENTQDLSADD